MSGHRARPVRRPWLGRLWTWLFIAWSTVPVVVAVQFSFNDGRSRSSWQGFSTRWWWGDPQRSLWHDPRLRDALAQSFRLAVLCIAVAVPVGAALAIGLTRWRSRASTAANAVLLGPLVTPEIVTGSMLFLTVSTLYDAVPLGTAAQLAGHVTFSLSYVVVIVRGRLVAIGPATEEAARDLGATRWQAVRLVLVPQLAPALVAAAMVVFAVSIDDFVLSAFLASDASSATVPMLIYASARGAPTPALNALATVMVLASLGAIALAVAVQRRLSGRRDTAAALTDVSSL